MFRFFSRWIWMPLITNPNWNTASLQFLISNQKLPTFKRYSRVNVYWLNLRPGRSQRRSFCRQKTLIDLFRCWNMKHKVCQGVTYHLQAAELTETEASRLKARGKVDSKVLKRLAETSDIYINTFKQSNPENRLSTLWVKTCFFLFCLWLTNSESLQMNDLLTPSWAFRSRLCRYSSHTARFKDPHWSGVPYKSFLWCSEE